MFLNYKFVKFEPFNSTVQYKFNFLSECDKQMN